MAIDLITFSGSNVLPEYDASLHDALGGLNGIISGCEVTSVNNGLHIAAGDGILAGRYFKIDEEQIAVTLPASGSVASALYIHMDLTDADTPIEIIAGPVPTYSYDRANGIYDLRLATYDATPTGLSNLVSTAPPAVNDMIIRRATAYSVGDIVFSPSCRDAVYECDVAGTTAEVSPVYGGGIVYDGTARFNKKSYIKNPLYGSVTSGSYTQTGSSSTDREIEHFSTERGLFVVTVSVTIMLTDYQEHPSVLSLFLDDTIIARQSFPANFGAWDVYAELTGIVYATGGERLKLRIPGLKGDYAWIKSYARFA